MKRKRTGSDHRICGCDRIPFRCFIYSCRGRKRWGIRPRHEEKTDPADSEADAPGSLLPGNPDRLRYPRKGTKLFQIRNCIFHIRLAAFQVKRHHCFCQISVYDCNPLTVLLEPGLIEYLLSQFESILEILAYHASGNTKKKKPHTLMHGRQSPCRVNRTDLIRQGFENRTGLQIPILGLVERILTNRYLRAVLLCGPFAEITHPKNSKGER